MRLLSYQADGPARDLQALDGPWTRAKSLDTFCPMGPWVVTADEIPDPGALRIRCRVNGGVRQDDSAAALVHGIAELIDPPLFLEDGDAIEVEIERIGTLRNRCRVVA